MLAFVRLKKAGNHLPPTWQTAEVEMGFRQKSALVLAAGFHFGKLAFIYWDGQFLGRKSISGRRIILGYRHYLGRIPHQGFYLQPTYKIVFQRFKMYTDFRTDIDNEMDQIVRLRFGRQIRLGHGLHLDLATGPSLGIGPVWYHARTQVWMDELENGMRVGTIFLGRRLGTKRCSFLLTYRMPLAGNSDSIRLEMQL